MRMRTYICICLLALGTACCDIEYNEGWGWDEIDCDRNRDCPDDFFCNDDDVCEPDDGWDDDDEDDDEGCGPGCAVCDDGVCEEYVEPQDECTRDSQCDDDEICIGGSCEEGGTPCEALGS